jgi:hypothetical protein
MEIGKCCITVKTTDMNSQYSLPVIHPSFELLKRSAGILHFIAASIILFNAIDELQSNDINKMLCYTQMVIAADIYLLVFFGGNLLADAPRLNLIFRLMEALALLGMSGLLIVNNHTSYGYLQLLISVGYFFLFYRERRVSRNEAIEIKPTGITLPDLLKDAEIGWNEVKDIIPHYHSILIETIRNKKVRFQLRNNLKIEELQQIDEFCQKHLVKK